MAAGAAFPGLFFCFAATVLLIIVSFYQYPLFPSSSHPASQVSISSPVWDKISFLDVTIGTTTTQFGVFGYTGQKPSVGYSFPPQYHDTKLSTGILHSLTFVLVLYPVGQYFMM
jgi:hypothetical protein